MKAAAPILFKPIIWAAAATALALLASLAVQTVRLAGERTAHAATRAERDRINAASTRAALDASTAYRALEATMTRNAQEIAHAYTRELLDNQRMAAALRADRNRLRDALLAGAAPGGGASQAAGPGDHGPAEPIGSVLARSLHLQEDLATMGERDAAIARGLQADREGLTCQP